MLEQFQTSISTYARQFVVPEAWIKAVILQESSGNPKAYRAEPRINDASYGLMQLLYRTAKGLGYTGAAEGLYDPDLNIQLGTKLLGQLRRQYGDNFERVYSAYNSGSPDKYLTSSQVADHVGKAVAWLTRVIEAEPLVATSGAIGVLILLILLWHWRGGKK
jgi:soluble lytic murein transglycosylase-like protein